MKDSLKHLVFLDQLRGVAILAVLLFHSLGTVYGFDTLAWDGWWRNFSVPGSFWCFSPLSLGGDAGVAIFFVVSGFCVHLSFQQQGQKWVSFFIRRFFRIYPAYLLAMVFCNYVNLSRLNLDFHWGELWMMVRSGGFAQQWLTHLLFIHNYQPETLFGITGALWSLAIEVQLYLLYPLLWLGVRKLGWRRVMFLLAGCELLIRLADGLFPAVLSGNAAAGRIVWELAHSPLGFWFSWAMGAWLADNFLHRRPLPFRKLSPAACLGGAVLVYFIRPLCPLQFLLFALLTAAVVSRFLGEKAPQFKLPPFASSCLVNIGWWSYSIYLLHQPLLLAYSSTVYGMVPAEALTPAVKIVLLAIPWLAVFAFGYLWYQLLERPAIACGRWLVSRFEGAQEAVSGTTLKISQFGGNRRLVLGVLGVVSVGSLLACFRMIPADPGADNNYAWELATNPDPGKRWGTLAVELAQDACNRTGGQSVVPMGTLAAAYAEAGDFDRARSTARQACDLAAENGQTNLFQVNRQLLELYQKNQPFRQSAAER